MKDIWNRIIFAALCALTFGQAWPQTPQFVTLDIEWENFVTYADNVADPSRLVSSPNNVNVNIRNFMPLIGIADIVAVNGRPAKGTWVSRGHFIMAFPNAMPGQAIRDLGRGIVGDVEVEILQPDGTRVGSLMSAGFVGGPAPPGAPQDLTNNFAVIGGTGAFLGAIGTLTQPAVTVRFASMEEDPANRRTHGGGRGRFVFSIIPLARPEIVTTTSGPAIFHSDFSPVTSSRPARAGETLIVRATGLGPTRPGLTAGASFAIDPPQQVNSPVEATVNGNAADVVNKIGWPGTTDTYRVDVRVPGGTTPGMAALRLTAAFISGREVSLPIQ